MKDGTNWWDESNSMGTIATNWTRTWDEIGGDGNRNGHRTDPPSDELRWDETI
jgi:hypothetical protein